MVLTVTDKIFWLRAGLGAALGVVCDFVFGTDYTSGILLAAIVFLASYYLVRRVWGKNFKPQEMTKLYTTGIGSYILLFLFLWILLFTVGLHSLNL
jgi:hypothetical protein